MGKLSEESFSAIKGELIDGRLTMSGMRGYLIGLLAFSGIMVGISLAVANADTIGWDTLSLDGIGFIMLKQFYSVFIY